MAKIFEATRLELDEDSIEQWKQKIPAGELRHEYRILEYIMIKLATEEYRKPYKVEVHKNFSQWITYVDLYFDFTTEQERFKFRLAGKGEELRQKIKQRIINNRYLQPIKVMNDDECRSL